MSVSSHLGIITDEYDARIRTFIPDYEEMLDVAARVATKVRRLDVVVDLGTGTGALAARVARLAPRTTILGIDEDERMLAMAARRLRRRRASFLHDSFLHAPLPACDTITASFALHHIASPQVKRALYVRARQALRKGGCIVSADCHPSALAALAADGRRAWRAHLARTHGPKKAEAVLRTWAKEDFYMPLEVELQLLKSAGFAVDVVWRRGSFAVVAAEASTRRAKARGLQGR